MTPTGDLLEDVAGLGDPELIARHVAGDPDAFGHLVRRHRDRLWAVAIRTLGDREEAADALQDALLSAFRRADSFRGDAAVTTWLHRIVVNACLDRVRRRRARPTEIFPEDEDRVAELAVAPVADPALAGEERLDIMAALRTLSDDQRAAIVLVDMEGYSVAEAATLLGCPTGTIKSRCARGRAQLLPLVAHLRASGNQTSTPAVASPDRSVPQRGPRRSADGGESND